MIMKFLKIINLLNNTPNQTSKFRTKNWVEIIDDPCGSYNINSQIELKTSILKLSLCDSSGITVITKTQF